MAVYFLRAPDGTVTGPHSGSALRARVAELGEGYAFAPAAPGATPSDDDFRPATGGRITATLLERGGGEDPPTRTGSRGRARPVALVLLLAAVAVLLALVALT